MSIPPLDSQTYVSQCNRIQQQACANEAAQFFRHGPFANGAQKLAGPLIGQTAEAGSRALVHAATSPDMQGASRGGGIQADIFLAWPPPSGLKHSLLRAAASMSAHAVEPIACVARCCSLPAEPEQQSIRPAGKGSDVQHIVGPFYGPLSLNSSLFSAPRQLFSCRQGRRCGSHRGALPWSAEPEQPDMSLIVMMIPPSAGKGGDVDHIVGPFYGPLKEVSPAGTSGLITNTVRCTVQRALSKDECKCANGHKNTMDSHCAGHMLLQSQTPCITCIMCCSCTGQHRGQAGTQSAGVRREQCCAAVR